MDERDDGAMGLWTMGCRLWKMGCRLGKMRCRLGKMGCRLGDRVADWGIWGKSWGFILNYTFTITPTETFHFPPISLLYLMLLLDFLSYNTYFGGCPKEEKKVIDKYIKFLIGHKYFVPPTRVKDLKVWTSKNCFGYWDSMTSLAELEVVPFIWNLVILYYHYTVSRRIKALTSVQLLSSLTHVFTFSPVGRKS